MRAGFAICVFAVVGLAPAQETAPDSRPWEPVRFHQVDELPALDEAKVIARATSEDDVLAVLSDGTVAYTVRKTAVSDVRMGEPDPTWLEYWVARLPADTVRRVSEAAASARARRQDLALAALLDLARVPFVVRKTRSGQLVGRLWLEMHLEPDGSLSPSDFDWNCVGAPVPTGRGQESFRVAATALMSFIMSNAGYSLSQGGPRSALDYLLSRQGKDGGFAGGDDPQAAMTNACGAIALCRALVLSKRDGKLGVAKLVRVAPLAVRRLAEDQNPDGSFGKDEAESRRLSTAVWSLFALKAGALAGIATDAAVSQRGLAWIEKTVAAIEARADGTTGPLTLTRARASRAVARLATGVPPQQIADDVSWLLKQVELGGTPVQDAEVLLFGTLTAFRCGGPLWDGWAKQWKRHVLETQGREGCANGTWTTPSIWWDMGGLLASTAFMTWSVEIYYRYPLADWVG